VDSRCKGKGDAAGTRDGDRVLTKEVYVSHAQSADSASKPKPHNQPRSIPSPRQDTYLDLIQYRHISLCILIIPKQSLRLCTPLIDNPFFEPYKTHLCTRCNINKCSMFDLWEGGVHVQVFLVHLGNVV
jgi:hypothetical protein